MDEGKVARSQNLQPAHAHPEGPEATKRRGTYTSGSSHRMQVWLVVPWGRGGQVRATCLPCESTRRSVWGASHGGARSSA